jgi:hypothetical protein
VGVEVIIRMDGTGGKNSGFLMTHIDGHGSASGAGMSPKEVVSRALKEELKQVDLKDLPLVMSSKLCSPEWKYLVLYLSFTFFLSS